MPAGRGIVVLSLVALASGLGACGTDSIGKTESAGTFRVDVLRTSFPARQHIAGAADLVLAVRNASDATIPHLTVTLWTGRGGLSSSKAEGAFNIRRDDPKLATPTTPVWLPAPDYPKLLPAGVTPAQAVTRAGAGAEAAQTDSYVFGPLAAGRSRTIVWRVTPVRAGSYTLQYAVAAGPSGGARAVAAGGGPVTGSMRVRIDGTPEGGCIVSAGQPYDGSCQQ